MSRWAMINVVRPAIRRATAASSRASVAGSTRAVASSSTTMSGLRSHTLASASSWASPAESPAPPGAEPTMDATVGQRRRGRRCAAPGSTASSDGASSNRVTLSRIVPLSSSTSCGIRATRRRSSASGMSSMRNATEPHAAAGGFDEAQHQSRQRRLAASGATDDTDRATGGEAQIDRLAAPTWSSP